MSESRALAVTILLSCLLTAGPGVAQFVPPASVVKVVTLQYQPAEAAFELIRPLLSPEGSVELQPASNTLVIRDDWRRMEPILATLESFDHPPRRLQLSIRLVEASAEEREGDAPLPAELVQRLHGVFRYHAFRQLGWLQIAPLERQSVRHRVGNDFRVEFELGAVLDERRIRLEGFRIYRARDRERPLLNTHLNLVLGQTLVLGLARNETSDRALVVVIEGRLEDQRPVASPVGDNPERR